MFFDTEGVSSSDDTITLPSGVVLDETVGCGGEASQLVVARWPPDEPDASPEIIDHNFGDIRLREDREVFTIALIKQGDTPPRPDSVPTLDNLSDVIAADGSTTTTVAGETTTTVAGTEATTTAPPEGATTTTAG